MRITKATRPHSDTRYGERLVLPTATANHISRAEILHAANGLLLICLKTNKAATTVACIEQNETSSIVSVETEVEVTILTFKAETLEEKDLLQGTFYHRPEGTNDLKLAFIRHRPGGVVQTIFL